MYLFKIQRELSLKLLENPGIKIIHKVTRAGATTSLAEASLKEGLRVVIVVPKKKIALDLIERLTSPFGHSPRMALIGSNPELCPKLRKIDVVFQFRKKCGKCELNSPQLCPFQKLVNCEFNLLGLTYAKLEALLAHSETFASQELLDKITSADVIIFDEFSSAVLPNIPTIDLIRKDKDGALHRLREDLMKHFVEAEHWSYSLLDFIREFEEKPSGVYQNQMFDPIDEFGTKRMFKKGWRLITELAAKGSDTRSLQRIFLAMFSKKVVIINDEGNVSLTPSVEDSLWYIKSFMRQLGTEKRVFVVDSYQPCSNFESIFGEAEPVLWGDKGDPLNTNATQLIIADTAHWGVFDFFKNTRLQEKYRKILNRIITFFSDEQVAIVCTNKRMAAAIHEWNLRGLRSRTGPLITWYRSELTRGVQLKNRDILILVGGPYLPKRAYLAQSKSFKVEDFVTEMEALQSDEEKLAELPHLLKLDDARGELINTVGRVKDPEGVLRSVVICCGIRESEVKKLLRDNSPFRLSKPRVVRPIGAGAMFDEGFWISVTWMSKWSVTKPEELKILARIISLTHQKRSLPASQVLLGSTELVKSVALQHQEVLEEYGAKIVFKTGGITFEVTP